MMSRTQKRGKLFVGEHDGRSVYEARRGKDLTWPCQCTQRPSDRATERVIASPLKLLTTYFM